MFTDPRSHRISANESCLSLNLSVCLSVCRPVFVQDMKGHCVRCLSDVGASPALSNVSYFTLLRYVMLGLCLTPRIVCCCCASFITQPLTSRCHSNGVVYIRPLNGSVFHLLDARTCDTVIIVLYQLSDTQYRQYSTFTHYNR